MRLIFLLFLTALLPCSLPAGEYESYSYSRKQIDYFEIQFSRNNNDMTIVGFADSARQHISAPTKDLILTKTTVAFEDKVLFTDSSLDISGKTFLYDNISDCRIVENNENIKITFLTTKDQSQLARFKKGNRVSFNKDIAVASDDFVRGLVLTITGDIEIEGEVNKDVIALFGNIQIKSSAVVRGNLLSLTEKVKLDDGATLYGEIYDNDKKGRGRKHRLYRGDGAFQVGQRLEYNRVDGLSISGNISHHDIDSLLPTVKLEIGYAAASDHGRFLFQAEQVVLREPSIIAGGKVFKQLASNDSHLISKLENSVAAALFKEDYLDYFEATGGSVYLCFQPSSQLSVKSGYTYYESDWLRSHRHLWSLFRGDELFDLNYNSWAESDRMNYINSVENANIGQLFLYTMYRSDSSSNVVFDRSQWIVNGAFEWSQKALSSDYIYRKYSLGIQRFQKISDRSVLLSRFLIANADGDLPGFQRFFLGGLGTLHGYNHKEFIGTSFWLTNLEYRVKFPGSEFGIAGNYDIGQIADGVRLDSEIEIKQAAGLSLFFEDDFKISLAKRLDRSFDDKLRFYVRFKHFF